MGLDKNESRTTKHYGPLHERKRKNVLPLETELSVTDSDVEGVDSIVVVVDTFVERLFCKSYVQNPSPKTKVPNPSPKSKIQSPEERDWG